MQNCELAMASHVKNKYSPVTYTHTGVNLHCHASLPPVPNVTLKYQKPSVQKFAEISKAVGTRHLILDQICHCQNLPKYQKSSLYNCWRGNTSALVVNPSAIGNLGASGRSQQATGSNLWIAWVSSRQRLLLIIKVFSLYDNSTRLNITSTMLPSSGSQLLNRRQATGSNLWIAWADDSFPSDNALSVPLVIFFMTVVSSDRLLTSRGIWFQSMSEWMSGYISADFPACQECPTLVENNYHQYLLLQSSFLFVCTVVSHHKSVYQR